MIELRWLAFESNHRVLQQRTKYLKTYNWNPLTETKSEVWDWSEWSDVPVYLCNIVNGERVVVSAKI